MNRTEKIRARIRELDILLGRLEKEYRAALNEREELVRSLPKPPAPCVKDAVGFLRSRKTG